MSNNTSWAVTRLAMSTATCHSGTALGGGRTRVAEAPMAAVSAYKPFIDARNDAQGGADAWSPPV